MTGSRMVIAKITFNGGPLPVDLFIGREPVTVDGQPISFMSFILLPIIFVFFRNVFCVINYEPIGIKRKQFTVRDWADLISP